MAEARSRVLACAVLLAVTTGCAPPSSASPADTPPPTPSRASPRAAPTNPPDEGCPVVPTDSPQHMVIDYVDFIRFGGREYLSGVLAAAAPVDRADLGEVVARSRCSLSELNSRTGREPGPVRDGDTAFLPPGTPIYAVRGWAPACRLAAEHDGKLSVYLASDPTATDHARSAPCAIRK